jgi:hypothetical protein
MQCSSHQKEHTEKAGRLSNLGCSLMRRFERLGEMGDIEKSILSLEDAVRLTPSSYANLPEFVQQPWKFILMSL